jgi:hypothetical protein
MFVVDAVHVSSNFICMAGATATAAAAAAQV